MAVLAAANRLRDTTGTPGRSVSGTLGAAPLVVESQRYEEWMKIATDNVSCARLSPVGQTLTRRLPEHARRKSRRPTPGTSP